jgi:hypothetical protein
MSTRPMGLGPREIIPDDPGPWSVAAPVWQGRMGRPDRRRPQSPAGMVISPPPAIELELAGLDPEATTAGAGPVRVIGATREAARAIRFLDDERLETIGPMVIRTYAVHDLARAREERPERDPAADLVPPVPMDRLVSGADLEPVAASPDGVLMAVSVWEAGGVALAVVRVDDRAVVRWVRGAIAAAWSPDAGLIAIGGDWGAFLAAPRPAGSDPPGPAR